MFTKLFNPASTTAHAFAKVRGLFWEGNFLTVQKAASNRVRTSSTPCSAASHHQQQQAGPVSSLQHCMLQIASVMTTWTQNGSCQTPLTSARTTALHGGTQETTIWCVLEPPCMEQFTEDLVLARVCLLRTTCWPAAWYLHSCCLALLQMCAACLDYSGWCQCMPGSQPCRTWATSRWACARAASADATTCMQSPFTAASCWEAAPRTCRALLSTSWSDRHVKHDLPQLASCAQ